MILDEEDVSGTTALAKAEEEPTDPRAPVGFGRNRSAWTVADQIVSSAQSLLISLWVTHEVSLSGVGAYAIVFATYQILLATNRPLNGDPLAVGFSAAEAADRRTASSAATGGAVLLGLITAALGVLAGSLLAAPLGGPLSHAVIVFSLGGLGIVLQDSWRYVFFTDGRPARALVNDAVVLLAMPPACLLAGRLAPRSAASLIGGWCAATAVGAMVGFWQTGIRPRLVRGWRWWRAILHFGAHVLGENLIANFAYAIGLAAAAAVAGVAALGRLRTAQVATNAANPLFLGIGTIVLADGTRLLASNPRRFPRAMVAGCMVAFVVPNLIALTWWFLPVRWGTVIVGSTWPVSRPLVLGAGAYVAGAAMSIVLSAGLRAMRFPSKAFKTRAAVGPITVTAAVMGARLWGPGGAIGGIAAAEWFYSVLMVPQFVAIWRQRRWAGQRPVTSAGDGSWRQ